MECPKCKHENRDGAKFCEECGTKLQPVCPNCGAELRPQAKFCDECGARIGETASKTAETPVPRLEDMHSQMKNLVPILMPNRLAQKYLTSDQYADGENRPITALFADISGFTALSQTHSSEDIFGMMRGCFDKLGSIIERYEGFISGCRGDGFLALFGVPLHENDAERAILAAIDIRDNMREQSLDVSIGINTASMTVGEVQAQLHSEYTAYGTGINLAARLQQTAQAGQITVGAGTYRLTRFAFDFEPTQPLQLKGFPEPVTAYVVQQVKARPEKLRGIEGLRAQMIGREREFADLREAADDLISGKGGIVSVIGEAGLGKSRLSLELKEYLKDRDVQWYEGRSVSIGQTVSYWTFLDILKACLNLTDSDSETQIAQKLRAYIMDLFPKGWESILPFLGRLLSVRLGDELDRRLTYFTPEQIRHQTLMALSHLFTELSHRKPILLILEDLHWADDLSLDLISILMDQLSTNPMMLLCIYRPERTHRCWQIGDSASRKCSDRYREMMLKRLSTVQSYQLVESLLSIENLPQTTKDIVLEKSEGNPFFIEEVIRWLIEHEMIYHKEGRWVAEDEVRDIDVPDTIQSVLLARVDRLGSETKYVLQCASVIGRMFRYRLLEHLSEHERDLDSHLTELEGRDLIYEERTVPELEYAFRHVLTQEATYHGILERRRMNFHRHVADGIESLYGDQLEKFYEELAHHHRLAGNESRALDYLLKSGVKAADQYSNQMALHYLDQAGELLDRSSEPHRKEKALLYEKRGEVLQRIGQWTKAIKEYEEALKWSDDRYQRAEIYHKMGWLECEEMQDKLSARKHLQLGLDELPEDDESVHRVRLEHDKIWTTLNSIPPQEQIVRCQNAVRIAEKMGYLQEQAILYTYIDTIQSFMRNYSDEYAHKAVSIAGKLGDLPQMAWVYFLLGHARIVWRKIHGKDWSKDDLSYLMRSIEISERTGNAQTQALAYHSLGQAYMELGEDEKAIEYLDKSMVLAEKTRSLLPISTYGSIMEIYANQNREDMVISSFSRIMKGFASLDIDEESQMRALFTLHYIGPGIVYKGFRDCYSKMVKDAGFPRVARKVLEELVKDVRSRPQKAWHYIQLTDLYVELGDMDDAKIYAEKAVSVIEDLGRNEYMAFSYPAYLFLDDFDAAENLAIKYLTNEIQLYSLSNVIYTTWRGVTGIYESYGQTDALLNLAERIWERFGESLKEMGVSHLLLEKVKLGNDTTVELMEEFTQESLPAGWEWIDSKGDCGYRMLNPGIEINVPSGNSAGDPRVLMELSGSFILETCLQSGSHGKRSGGLIVLNDKNLYITMDMLSSANYFGSDFGNTVCLAATSNGSFAPAGTHNYMEDKAWLRLERKGYRFTGYVSPDGENWYRCGYIDLQMEDPIQVGFHSTCSNPPSTSTRFEYFKIYRPT